MAQQAAAPTGNRHRLQQRNKTLIQRLPLNYEKSFNNPVICAQYDIALFLSILGAWKIQEKKKYQG